MFPVSGNKAKTQSFWGDARDGGARKHEGIDIMAPRGAPVVAVHDGIISVLNENNAGGKVVWLRPNGKDYTLYYAHLDEQLVSTGQRVNAGDTIGLVGNTGNARTTVPHLHFGIYTTGGAVDPYPFVNPTVQSAPEVRVTSRQLQTHFILKSGINVPAGNTFREYKAKTVIIPISASSKEIAAFLPDGNFATIPIASIHPESNSIMQYKLKDSASIYERPVNTSPRKVQLPKNTELKIYGYFENFAFVKTNNNIIGWILITKIR